MFFKNRVCEKILQADAFALEYHLDAAQTTALSEIYYLPNGQSLTDFFSAKKLEKISRRIKLHTGLPFMQFLHLKPIITVNLLTDTLLQKDMPYNLDQFLWNFAKENDKELHGIETYEEQLAILKKIPLDLQLKALVSLAKNFKNHRKNLLKTTKAYERGDIHQLYQYAKRGTNQTRKIMIYNRNATMVERMLQLLPQKSMVFAIGAAHLAGGKGVLRLLKQQAYRLKQLNRLKD